MSTKHLRFVLMMGIGISIALFVVRLAPVLARYQAEAERFAELVVEGMQPSEPVVAEEPDSPRPGMTLHLQGRPIKELYDAGITWGHFSFHGRSNLLYARDMGRFFDLRQDSRSNDRQRFEFSRNWQKDGSIFEADFIFNANGPYGVIATVSEFPDVRFWNWDDGKLLQVVDDEHPTIACQPDASKRHKSGLRYSHTSVRRLVASPSSFLFAIGKIDGTIELWGDLAYREHPEWIRRDVFGIPSLQNGDGGRSADEVAAIKAHAASVRVPASSRKFGLLMRKKVHEGEIVDLKFCEGGLKLLSVCGSKITGFGPVPSPDGSLSNYSMPIRSEELVADLVLSSAIDLAEEWRQKLDEPPGRIAVPIGETVSGPHWREPNAGNFSKSRMFAIGNYFNGVALGSLSEKKLTSTLKFPQPGPSVMVQSLSFHRDESLLCTLHTAYAGKDESFKTETVLSLWDVTTQRRVSTARLAGQCMSAGWDASGSQLALLRFDHRISQSPAKRSGLLPWQWTESRPHMFHVRDVKTASVEPSLESPADR